MSVQIQFYLLCCALGSIGSLTRLLRGSDPRGTTRAGQYFNAFWAACGALGVTGLASHALAAARAPGEGSLYASLAGLVAASLALWLSPVRAPATSPAPARKDPAPQDEPSAGSRSGS